ncbi:hypothetical protein COU60_05125 [Candidatus Pacearchaeota archaeon CG10_big_fil_rev_8_21_14_0_10_34_76]|nr:MAG: hypothetical protein COU60_05125 [Candidatus Pacearchaeota archaeon CG10_big_fil_rev_8_21_14_0_10_34_76]
MSAVKYTRPIDGHVHLRWLEHSIPFALFAFQDAATVGYKALVEQVNTDPPLISLDMIRARKAYIDLVKKQARAEDILHKSYIGMTDDEGQVKTALRAVIDNPDLIAGDKTFYVHSTANMGLLRNRIWVRNWAIKREMAYRKVSTSHLEDENTFDKSNPFNPKNPMTHSLYQNEKAELVQTERQIRLARDLEFEGIFVAHHVSSPDTIDFLYQEKDNMPFQIIIESTPHHILLNTDDYKIHGNRVKINPPLRSPESQKGVLERGLEGKIDIIGTDHAPHPLERKDSVNPSSGIPVIPIFPFLAQTLLKKGMSKGQLKKITFDTPNKIFFSGELEAEEVEVEYNPGLWDKYGYNPFSRRDGTLRLPQVRV